MILSQKENRQESPVCRQAGQARLQSLAPARQSPYGSSRMADGHSNSGQALLIVVLVMVISLTIGLSIASKTITNLRTTTEEVNSAQALSAAETGAAQSLKTKADVPAGSGFTSNNTTFSSSITSLGGTTSFLVNAGNVIPQDEGADVWLITHDDSGNLNFSPQWSGNLTIYWGDSSTGCNNAALEIIVVTGTSASDAIATRYGYDPCSARASSNSLAFVSSSLVSSSGKNFYHTANINGITNGLVVRIIPLYANTILAVAGSSLLPQQGSIITSEGTSSNVVRKISVVANYYSLPSEFFTYGILVPR